MIALLLVSSMSLARWEDILLITGNIQWNIALVYYRKVPLMAWILFFLLFQEVGVMKVLVHIEIFVRKQVLSICVDHAGVLKVVHVDTLEESYVHTLAWRCQHIYLSKSS